MPSKVLKTHVPVGVLADEYVDNMRTAFKKVYTFLFVFNENACKLISRWNDIKLLFN